MAAPTYSSTKHVYATTPTKPPSKGHTRRATSYTKPSPGSYDPPPYSSGPYYTTTVHTPQRQPEYVSASIRNSTRTKSREASKGTENGTKQRRHSPPSVKPDMKYAAYKSQNVHDIFVGDDDEGYYSPSKDGPPPPPYHEYPSYSYETYVVTDHRPRAGEQVAAHKRSPTDPPKYKSPTRNRSASYSHHHQQARPSSGGKTSTPQRSRAKSNSKSPPKASDADAARAGIPAGYSYKNWDPSEEPILLLGSVFDANSLGKWIYDWTVYNNGAATPMADLAGELWLLLIQLAGKIKRAEECIPRIRRLDDRDLVDDFLESGERLWKRFNKILKTCEDFMWRVAKKESKRKGTSATPSMGAKSGCEFVDSIFGRDRKLEDTEKLMTGMRLWSMRFDANCEDILRHPSG